MYSRSIHRESERQTVDERGYEAGLGTSMGCLIWKEKEGEEQGMDFRLVTYGPTCVLTATEVVTRGYGLQDGVWQHEVSFRLVCDIRYWHAVWCMRLLCDVLYWHAVWVFVRLLCGVRY